MVALVEENNGRRKNMRLEIKDKIVLIYEKGKGSSRWIVLCNLIVKRVGAKRQ